jgi:hypothetical protein
MGFYFLSLWQLSGQVKQGARGSGDGGLSLTSTNRRSSGMACTRTSAEPRGGEN